jgi:hypothetical protein
MATDKVNIEDLEKHIADKLKEINSFQSKLEDVGKQIKNILPIETKKTKFGQAHLMRNGSVIFEFKEFSKAKAHFDKC